MNAVAPKKRPSKASARQVALETLIAVDEDQAYANIELNRRLRSAQLTAADAAFVTELVSGTLRMQLTYDSVICSAAQRSVDDIDPLTRNILRMGAHQLLTLSTAHHAAIHESVELQRRLGKASATGFVNAILRAISKRSLAEWQNDLAEHLTNDAKLELSSGHPQWIIRALRQALNAEHSIEELEALLEADNVPPKVQLAILPGAELSDLGHVSNVDRRGPSPIGLELQSGSPQLLTEDARLARPGLLRVQDQGSQLVALTLLEATPKQDAESWLDLCAGPGGKTAILAAYARERGARVRAVEPSAHRARLVREAVRPNRDVAEVVIADGSAPEAFEGMQFDRILVDAPCTGLGALRRRPEARLRKKPSDVANLSTLQAKLLGAAIDHLKPGGLVGYVTCSPHLAETRGVVDQVLREHQDCEELDAKVVMQRVAREDLDLRGDAPSAQLWPHRNGTDAMFISIIQRRLEP